MSTYSRPTILNVDDNEGCRYAVTRILELNNFNVKEAATGAEALRLARSEQPDLVLLDINLPDLNGYEVCKRLKSEPVTARIPVLHITASYMNPADMARGLESGAENYLVEPVEPEVLIATINSILRARHAAESARAMAREWQGTFDAIGDGVAVVDAENRIRRANASLARLSGRSVGDLIGVFAPSLWEREAADGPFARALVSRQRETLEFDFEGKRLRVTVDPVFDEEGAPAGAVHIVSDITETVRLAEQFRESQKFETVGTLAAGVAHDFNNLLTSIMGNASLIAHDTPKDSPHQEKLADLMHSSQRAADLTKQLLAYSGKGRHFMQRLELSNLVRRIEGLIHAAVPKKIELTIDLAKDLPRVDADANQVQQLVLNFVSNAVEAIGDEHGAITIRTGSQPNTGSVYIEVADTGCGMDAETRARIFDPFFTTKFTGRGLGLAAVAGIVRGHKAEIGVTTAPGKGSTFRVSFPSAEPAATEPQPSAEPSGDTVLVVDDEEMVRRIAQASLEIRGYKVVIANNGLEAIREVRQNPSIGLVLLDLTMPVMGGEEAIDEILAERPGVKVIVSTGYDHREALARFQSKPVAGYLQKPYTSRQLADKVKSVLKRK